MTTAFVDFNGVVPEKVAMFEYERGLLSIDHVLEV